MRCPACKANNENRVIDSRMTEAGAAIRRRRSCMACGRRFTTKERIEEELRISVIKVDGRRQSYDREKIYGGVERACAKLAVSEAQIQELLDRVETRLFTNHDREASSEAIGRYVGAELRLLDPVAYVRFMSVHRKFKTVEEFVEAIREVRERAAEEIPAQGSLFDG
ncbi:MAG: transcriptional repressor NrdR [Planctomycetes bacterium]|nr:transcriptional repressor NrdR [Planctomycetota bacterium]